MPDYTTRVLVEDLKRRGSIPTDQALFTEEDFVALMDDAQRMRIIPLIMKARQEFFTYPHDTAFSDPAQRRFPIPAKAIATRVRSVQLVDKDGFLLRNIPRLSPKVGEHGNIGQQFPYELNHRAGYYFENNELILTEGLQVNSTDQLRINIYRRPNKLVYTRDAGQITNIAGGLITLTQVPSSWVAGNKIDVINTNPTFDAKIEEVELLAVGLSDITIDTASAAKLSIGDWVTLEGESVVPQYPVDLHQILVQHALVNALKALGDIDGSKLALEDAQELESNLLDYISDRDDASGETIIPEGDFEDPFIGW